MCKDGGDALIECRELGVVEDRPLHLRDGNPELGVTGAISWREQGGAHRRQDAPVVGQCLDVAVRDTATQMGVNVLPILRLGTVNVTREVEVVVVLRVGDFAHRDEARVARQLDLSGERVDDLVDVLLP